VCSEQCCFALICVDALEEVDLHATPMTQHVKKSKLSENQAFVPESSAGRGIREPSWACKVAAPARVRALRQARCSHNSVNKLQQNIIQSRLQRTQQKLEGE
jgi:hypothetical protein